jgi:phage-related protein
LEVFGKKTQKTTQSVIENAKRRLRHYDDAVKE